MSLFVENEKALKKKQAELEKELNEKEKDPEVQIVQPPAQASAESVVKAMSQVILRVLEIVGLKNKNNNIEKLYLKREEERKAWEKNANIVQIKKTSQ